VFDERKVPWCHHLLYAARRRPVGAAAAGTPLANVRMIAEKAATAWNNEALVAEKREQRQGRTRQIAAHLLEEKRETREQCDRLFSENPDGGFAAI
jgi:sirohydrochlorin ferrochelatase